MTLVSDIIRDAYRESNLISITADPTANETAEALRLLNRVVASTRGQEAGEELDQILIGRNNISRPQGFPYYDGVPDGTLWYVPLNARLVLNLTSAQTVYLDPMPIDGARYAIQDKSGNLSTHNLTVHGNGRTIAGAESVTYSTDNVNIEYMYRADTGDWLAVSPLLVGDTFPFPADFDDLFVIGLAMRLNPRNGATADPQSAASFQRLMRNFKARYRQSQQMVSELALVRTLGTRHRFYDDTRLGNNLFNSGWGFPVGGYRW
jgi:hypothetical protein